MPSSRYIDATTLTVLTVNTHKGFTSFNRRFMLHELREALRMASPDIVFLQEVLENTSNMRNGTRPGRPPPSTNSSPTRCGPTLPTAAMPCTRPDTMATRSSPDIPSNATRTMT